MDESNEETIQSINEPKNYSHDIDTMLMSDENLADILISKYDYLDSCISNENFDAALCSNLVMLLKFILENGPHLDEDINHKEQMDMFFTLFRNILRNNLKYLPDSINLLILRLIEIRASKWQIKPAIEEYYMKKVDKLSNNNMFKSNNNSRSERQSIRMSKSFGDMLNSNITDTSFRNSRLLKTNSKGVLKDEVLIKNSNSGKVMGIKGRRVHMIEEMSDTIISFQKVSPNAKDRLVLITGYNRENIEKAKNLIDVTIRQNISPIPFDSENCCNNDSVEDDINVELNEIDSKCKRLSFYNNIQSEDENSYSFPIIVGKKEVRVKISDQLIGKKLECFLNRFKFTDSILNNETTNLESKIETNESKKKETTYDREFLLSLKDSADLNSCLLNDIKQHNLIRQ